MGYTQDMKTAFALLLLFPALVFSQTITTSASFLATNTLGTINGFGLNTWVKANRIEINSFGNSEIFFNQYANAGIQDASGFILLHQNYHDSGWHGQLVLSEDVAIPGNLDVAGIITSTSNFLWVTNIVIVTNSIHAYVADYAKTCTGLGYTNIYRALLTQTGTAAPVATVLENTFGYGSAYTNLVWARTGVGLYTVTFTNGFTTSKTFCMIPGTSDVNVNVCVNRITTNTISISTYFVGSVSPGYGDSFLGVGAPTPIEILVYP